MAAGTIITVLSNVPWGTVIDAAPKVAEGATKLWNAVTRKKTSEGSGTPHDDSAASSPTDLESLQASVNILTEEMLAATALIKQLADQNTVLVQRLEANRKRLQQMSYAGTFVSVLLVCGVAHLLSRG